MAEVSFQVAERTGRVASAPSSATVSQPKGPNKHDEANWDGMEAIQTRKEGRDPEGGEEEGGNRL